MFCNKLLTFLTGHSMFDAPFIYPTVYTVYLANNTGKNEAVITLNVTSYGSDGGIVETYAVIEDGERVCSYFLTSNISSIS